MKFELEEFHRNISDEELLSDMKRVAAELNLNSLTTRQQNEHGKFRMQTIILRFGSWVNALEKAGLKVMKRQNKQVPYEELFKNLEEIWIKLGHQPKYRDMQEGISNYGPSRYTRIFGSWRMALMKFIEYVNREEAVSSESAIKNIAVEPITKHKTSRNINWKLRFVVMRRDNFKCQNCGRSPATDQTVILHIDHKTAWTNGGETVIENLETLCSVCNIGKSNLE